MMTREKGIQKLFLTTTMAVTLVACEPEVSVKVSTSDILEVATSGAPQMLEFDASIENSMVTIDDEKRAEVSAIVRVIEKHFEGVEVDVTWGDDEFEIEIEGELELTVKDPSTTNPWYFSVQPTDSGGYLFRQQQSVYWRSFRDDLKVISFFAEPDDFLPVNIRLKNNGGALVVGGAILDGKPLSGYERITLNGDRINLNFDGDHWEDAPVAFLLTEVL